jgi:hypothetical protein
MPELEKLVPASNKQKEEIPAPVSKPAVTPLASDLPAYIEAEESLEIPQDEVRGLKFTINKISDFECWFSIVLEVMLGIRFFFKLIGADPSNPFAAILYALTDIILFPFSTLIHNPSLQVNQAFETTTLLAMFAYWLIFWAIRWFVRILVSAPEEPIK